MYALGIRRTEDASGALIQAPITHHIYESARRRVSILPTARKNHLPSFTLKPVTELLCHQARTKLLVCEFYTACLPFPTAIIATQHTPAGVEDPVVLVVCVAVLVIIVVNFVPGDPVTLVVLLMTLSILMWKPVQRCDRQAQAFLHIHHNLFISLPCLLSPPDWTEQLQRDRRDRQNAASPAAHLSIHSQHHLPTPLFPGAAYERTTHYLWIHRPT